MTNMTVTECRVAVERSTPGTRPNNRRSVHGRQRNRHGFRYGKVKTGAVVFAAW